MYVLALCGSAAKTVAAAVLFAVMLCVVLIGMTASAISGLATSLRK